MPSGDEDPSLDENSQVFNLAGGSCFDFHKQLDHLFVVGTEEGKIFKCSKEYNNQYLLSFEVRAAYCEDVPLYLFSIR